MFLWGGTLKDIEIPDKTGYTFIGWYADPQCTQNYDLDSPVTNNIAIFSKWDLNEKILYGDIDGDGTINAKDVTTLRRYIAGGWEVSILSANADIDDNSEINAKDVTMLRRYLAGGWGVVLNGFTS